MSAGCVSAPVHPSLGVQQGPDTERSLPNTSNARGPAAQACVQRLPQEEQGPEAEDIRQQSSFRADTGASQLLCPPRQSHPCLLSSAAYGIHFLLPWGSQQVLVPSTLSSALSRRDLDPFSCLTCSRRLSNSCSCARPAPFCPESEWVRAELPAVGRVQSCPVQLSCSSD